MSIIDNTSKTIMVRAMRNVLENSLVNSTGYISESKIVNGMNYVNESATYEQLLNLTFNPFRDSNYLPAHVLEGAAAILYASCLTGRSKIGPRAIAEGAVDLQNSTGCVITESMLDAAYNAVKYGSGLKVIGEAYDIITEGNRSKELATDALEDWMKKNGGREPPQAVKLSIAKKYGVSKPENWAKRSFGAGGVAGHANHIGATINKGLVDNSQKKLAAIEKALATPGISPAHKKALLASKKKLEKALAGQQANLDKFAGRYNSAIASKMPWYKTKAAKYGAIGLGALGAAGAGYGIYKWMKNKKKNEDQ